MRTPPIPETGYRDGDAEFTWPKRLMNIMVDWTDEKIAALSSPDLKNLMSNAERKGVAALVETCKTELEKRGANKPRGGVGKPRTEIKDFEHTMSEQIAAVGKEMAAKYDLSEETAKARSEGIKGFRAHKLFGSDGRAKLGGMQRDGSVAVERYISHRRGNDIVSLGVFLLKDQPIDAHEFHVIAPAAMLDDAKPIAQIRPIATDKQKQSADSGRSFSDLPSAAVAFDAALAKLTA